MLRDALLRIAREYPQATREPLERHPLAAYIRGELPRELASLLHAKPGYEDVVVEGTKFVGNWAKTPWLAVLDPRLTRTAQRGIYVVVAFSKDFRVAYFALGIGVTNTTSAQRLKLISHLQRKFVTPQGFNHGPVGNGIGSIETKTRYDDAQVFYRSYPIGDLPDEPALIQDLLSLIDLLRDIAASEDPEVVKLTESGSGDQYSKADVRRAFAQTTPDSWQSKPGIEPYWHVVVDGETKPVKAVYSSLTGKSTSSFNTVEARAVFTQAGFECRDMRTTVQPEPPAPQPQLPSLSLMGTSKGLASWLADGEAMIREKGALASWWSFRLRDEAKSMLKLPFYLYLNTGGGTFPVRARIDEYVTSPSASGMESPWPEITLPDSRGKARDGEEQSRVFRTWFKVSGFEHLNPSMTLKDFSPAPGLSSRANLLNQNAFGYAYENTVPTTISGHDRDWLNSTTLLPELQIESLIEAALSCVGPLILAGPPGTSKTHTALALAKHLTEGDASRIAITQFHPGYTYESFIEGLRPKLDSSSGVTFVRQDGLVLQTIRRMQDQGHYGNVRFPYFILIDEFNRANLPRVLGELLYLFEYGNQPVQLQYSGAFSLPKNLRFIGTMNTADRSIRSLDSALRRRLEIFELEPSAGILASYYKEHELNYPSLISGFEKLNQKLMAERGRHHTIGHTFFMRPGFSSDDLEQVWSRRVRPLIEEYFIDETDLVAEFSRDAFWPEK